MSLAFPPFTPVVKKLIIINAVVFVVVLIGNIGARNFGGTIFDLFGFEPRQAVQGLWLWQFVTYGFLHAGVMHLLVNMLSLWMFGSQLEMDWRSRRFTEFFFFCLIGAAVTTVVLAYVGAAMQPSDNWFVNRLATLAVTTTVGASGATYGILLAFGMLYGDRELFMFPIPIAIKAKYLVGIIVFLVFASTLSGGARGVAEFAHLGGLLFAFIYVRFLGRHGLLVGASERYYGIRNSYYKWKRRRAGRKFEVYMRQYDRKQYFDEHGNYRPPQGGEIKGGNGESRPPWVN